MDPKTHESARGEACFSAAKPRQMIDGSIKMQKVMIPPNSNKSTTDDTSTITYSEHRSSSISSSSTMTMTTDGSQHITIPDPNDPMQMMGMPAPASKSSGGLLKRSASWKKFKNTVKETVSGIVNMSVGQSPPVEGSSDEKATLKHPQHLCENLTPDLERKLIRHCSNEEIFEPTLEEVGASALGISTMIMYHMHGKLGSQTCCSMHINWQL